MGLAHTEPVFVSGAEALDLWRAGARFVDVRDESAYSRGTVPGAGHLSWQELREGGLRSGALTEDPKDLAAHLKRAGVRSDTAVVVVGAAREGWGEEGRLYWTLDYLGHSDVHVLDGGFSAWLEAGGDIRTEPEPVPPGDFLPAPDEGRRARLDEVRAHVRRCASGPCGVTFWDTREIAEYNGETPHHEARGGHLPGARHLHFKDLMGAEGRLLPVTELGRILEQAGIHSGDLVVAYCTGGVRSGFAYAVLRHLGWDKVENYDGSMWEWSQQADTALVVGAADGP